MMDPICLKENIKSSLIHSSLKTIFSYLNGRKSRPGIGNIWTYSIVWILTVWAAFKKVSFWPHFFPFTQKAYLEKKEGGCDGHQIVEGKERILLFLLPNMKKDISEDFMWEGHTKSIFCSSICNRVLEHKDKSMQIHSSKIALDHFHASQMEGQTFYYKDQYHHLYFYLDDIISW